MRKTMSDKGVAALKSRATRYAVSDPELRGHWIRVQPGGQKTFWAITYTPGHKQIWTKIGPVDIGIAAAREQARAILQRVRAGKPAIEPEGQTFAAVAANWIKRHVDAKKIRTKAQIERRLAAHVLPVWNDREFSSIHRNDVALLLDDVEDDHGAHEADHVLAIVRAVMTWHAIRHGNYNSPIVPGMRRTSPKESARTRVLNDEELRAAWVVAEADGGAANPFGALVRLCLLTAQRSRKVAAMKWSDIKDGVWTVERKPREKNTGGTLALPQTALDILEGMPRFVDCEWIFAGSRPGQCWNNFSDGKKDFDKKLAAVLPNVPQWGLHDLRRTARSLMSRAGVLSEHAERVLGHTIGGVEEIYDRHPYQAEKADALTKLAALIERIVHPRPATVLPIERSRHSK